METSTPIAEMTPEEFELYLVFIKTMTKIKGLKSAKWSFGKVETTFLGG